VVLVVSHLEGHSAQGKKIFPLSVDRVTIGRAPDAGLRLDGDAAVSRLHALCERLDGGWRVSDLGSRNGTFINKNRIIGPVALRPGDEVQIGAWLLTYHDDSADAEGTLLDDNRADISPLPAAEAAVELSAREQEVLALVARGETDEQIANSLFISVATVRSHLDRIRDKTGCRRRPELTRFAVEQGIVPATRTDLG
jgi:DNA-binding CsgD family transcriptional regulator